MQRALLMLLRLKPSFSGQELPRHRGLRTNAGRGNTPARATYEFNVMGHGYQWIARTGCQRSDTDFAGGDSAPELIYLAQCVPNPPDKGEKIRAFHELQ